jgi:hypothetical protein
MKVNFPSDTGCPRKAPQRGDILWVESNLDKRLQYIVQVGQSGWAIVIGVREEAHNVYLGSSLNLASYGILKFYPNARVELGEGV